jgi:tRNA modification GTPase
MTTEGQTAAGDTIVALSSGRLPAGVAVVRISGAKTRFVLETIAGLVPAERVATYGTLVDGKRNPIDRGLVLFFQGPRSFTGEDIAEFHIHGGQASVAALLATLTAIEGVRQAEPGEFTRRAFLNGKLDLTETEALADLIEAETEAQRRFALANASGAQKTLYLGWRQRLIHARAMIEAEIDFSDEEDVPGAVSDTIWRDIAALNEEIGRHMAGFHAAEIIRDGYDVVILGAPNAGKSSLFNALARRDAAIVTDEPGTTRDLLDVVLDLGGLKIRVTDTAGLRNAAGKVETIGIERARGRAREADLVLMLEDMTAPARIDPGGVTAPVLRIGTKADKTTAMAVAYDLRISSVTGQGIETLLDAIRRRADAATQAASDILPSRLRHMKLLEETQSFLERAQGGRAQELRAEELRLAADRLGRIVGTVDVEDLLDVIFSQFCIGK